MVSLHKNTTNSDFREYAIKEQSPDGEVEALNNRVWLDTLKHDVILPDPAIKYNAGNAMSERFLKLIPSPETMWLLKNKPNAFLLLTQIAERARRENGHPDGLKIGECYLGDHKNCGLTEQEYRTAKSILVGRSHIEIIETCRTRKKQSTDEKVVDLNLTQKSTTGITTVGTKVKLVSSSVYDVNINVVNDRVNDRPTTDQRPTNDEQERIKKDKKEKEERKNIKKENFFSKGKKEAIKPTTSDNVRSVKLNHGPVVKLTSESYSTLCEDHTKSKVDEFIEKMNDYCLSTGRTYKDHAATLRIWIKNPKNQNYEKKNDKSPKDAIRKRQLDEYTQHNGSFNDCVKSFD